MASATFGDTASTTGAPVTVASPLPAAAPTPDEPIPAVAPATPAVASSAPGVAPLNLAPTVPGPVITPLQGTSVRRLEDDDETANRDKDDEQTVDLDEEDLDEFGLDEPRVEKISIRFKNGLKYQVDHDLMDAMIKEGLFQQLEEVKTADHPLRIHSYEVTHLNPESHKEDSGSTSTIGKFLQFPQRAFLIAAVACGTLMGVAFALRRARSGYESVEEDILLQGPVE